MQSAEKDKHTQQHHYNTAKYENHHELIRAASIRGITVVVHRQVNTLPREWVRQLGIVCRGRAFRECQGTIGRIDNSDECCPALLTVKSIGFKPRRVDIGGLAAMEVQPRMAPR